MNINLELSHIKKINKGYKTLQQLQGFTLIELVIVIVLVGILAAVAVPKFASLTTQARQSSASGIAGGLSAAVGIAHAQWLANGGGTGASITLEGQVIYLSTTGWPEDTSGAVTGVATATKCLNVWNALLNSPPPAGSTCTGSCQYLVTGATSTCTYKDQQGTGANTITYNISTGQVSGP